MPPLPDRSKRKARNKTDRKFARMIPGKEVRGCRAEFDNRGKPSEGHVVRWRGILHIGEGLQRREFVASSETALVALTSFTDSPGVHERIAELLHEADLFLGSTSIQSDALQSAWVNEDADGGPDWVVKHVSQIVDRWLPKSDWARTSRRPSGTLPILRSSGIRIRVGVGLALASRLAELANDPTERHRDPLRSRWQGILSAMGRELDLREASDRLSLF